MRETKQIKMWKSKFGYEYTQRNPQSVREMESLYRRQFGTTRTAMNRLFLRGLDKNIRILEVGCNIGNQLLCLQKMGFRNLYGIEVQPKVVQLARKRSTDINFLEGSMFEIPFKDGYFDLVFTSGVLIHISPKDLKNGMKEIVRVSKKFIWGFEYYSESPAEIQYRGHKNLLWKNDFKGLYLKTTKGLKVVKSKYYKYKGNENRDEMFLIKKK